MPAPPRSPLFPYTTLFRSRLMRHRDDRIAALLRTHFGDVRPATTAELQAEIERLAARIRSGPGDPFAGQRPFAARCADRKSTRLNSSHTVISYAVFCLKKK